MQIELSEEADEFIRRAVETGRHRRPEDAVREALELWIERERRREELLAALDQAEASVARGAADGVASSAASARGPRRDLGSRI